MKVEQMYLILSDRLRDQIAENRGLVDYVDIFKYIIPRDFDGVILLCQQSKIVRIVISVFWNNAVCRQTCRLAAESGRGTYTHFYARRRLQLGNRQGSLRGR